MATYPDRGEGIHDLVHLLTEDGVAATVPHLADKIRILLTGQLGEEPVLAAGNIWLPEKKLIKRFISALGEEVCGVYCLSTPLMALVYIVTSIMENNFIHHIMAQHS
jgi:hypothetical protein